MGRGKTVVLSAGVFLAGGAMAAPAASAAPWPTTAKTVTGTWHLHTNDCFFGVCSYTLHLVQQGSTITGSGTTSTGSIAGSVHARNIRLNFSGVSPEDGWSCTGRLNVARSRLRGTFADGTGGTGSCRAHRTGP
jgi:hypothetical protein